MLNLCPGLAFLFISIESLPAPHNVTMLAVNTQYILNWDWDQTRANYTVKFTVEYTYSNKWKMEESYSRACYRSPSMQCDLTPRNLSFFGCYMLRVRVERRGETSIWSLVRFCPDEHASLGPPSRVKVNSGDGLLTVSITEPLTAYGAPMSSIMASKISFQVQYWEAHASQQKYSKELQVTEATLSELKPWTVYCLHISAFNQDYNKASPFTKTQCVQTKGRSQPLVWVILLPVACFGLLMAALVYWCHRESRSPLLIYELPRIIMDVPVLTVPLLELQMEHCTALTVVAVQRELARGQPRRLTARPQD